MLIHKERKLENDLLFVTMTPLFVCSVAPYHDFILYIKRR